MKTCKYCGTKLNLIGEYKDEIHFHCPYCDLTFELAETCENRKRKMSVPDYYNDSYFLPTKDLLKKNTVELFHILKDCRADWYNIYRLLSKIMNLDKDTIQDSTDLDEATKPLYNEYINITKQKFIIENILLEKAGFIPEKITDEFLGQLVEQGRIASSKPMYIYIKKEKHIKDKVKN